MMAMTPDLHERHERLWVPVAAPIIWATHFLCCYVAAALWCGRFASTGGTGGLVVLISAFTVIASIAITALFLRGLKRHAHQLPIESNDDDSPEDRRHFLAFTTMLLAGLSLVATLFVGVAAVAVDLCH
jgi:hypothetical protein